MKPERGKGFTKIFIYCFALFLGVEIALYFVSVLSLYFLIPPPPPHFGGWEIPVPGFPSGNANDPVKVPRR